MHDTQPLPQIRERSPLDIANVPGVDPALLQESLISRVTDGWGSEIPLAGLPDIGQNGLVAVIRLGNSNVKVYAGRDAAGEINPDALLLTSEDYVPFVPDDENKEPVALLSGDTPFILGRGEATAERLGIDSDPTVSSIQATIGLKDGKIQIRDLEASNDTTIVSRLNHDAQPAMVEPSTQAQVTEAPAAASEQPWGETRLYAASDLIEDSRYAMQEYNLRDLGKAIQVVEQSDNSAAQKSAAIEVLTKGTVHGQEVGLSEAYRNSNAEATERKWMASLIGRAPEVADVLVQKEVVGFHATSSFALAGLIEDGGLLSGRSILESGKASITGAHDGSVKGQASISFGVLAATETNINGSTH